MKIKVFFLTKITLLAGIFLILSLLKPQNTYASIGTIELRSTSASQDYRCYASSLIKVNNKYDVAVNCVNLIFPANPPEVSYYILWSTPLSGKGPVKVGDLGKGIATFEIQDPFSSLFVTLETNPGVRSPSKTIVMNGGVNPIKFLQIPTTPTPTPEVQAGQQNQNAANTANLSTKDKLLLALQRAGIAAVIALVAIVGLIFVVTRSRG